MDELIDIHQLTEIISDVMDNDHFMLTLERNGVTAVVVDGVQKWPKSQVERWARDALVI